jgi:hypothetical protein
METTLILASSKDNLIESDVTFLLQLGNVDAAEEYLMKRITQINKFDYITLTVWVDQLVQNALLASLIYRELINDILQRGYTKTYHYAVDYWFQLQQLSPKIPVSEKKGKKKRGRYPFIMNVMWKT